MVAEPANNSLTPQPHTVVDSPGVTSLNASRLAGGSLTLGIIASAAWRFFGAGFVIVLLFVAAVAGVVIGIVLFLRGRREERAWHALEFQFPEWGLPLGSVSAVAVQRKGKVTIADAADVRLPVHLQCTEVVRYRQGTDTKTVRRTVVEDQLEILGSIENNTFTGELVLPIPVDRGAPTLELRNNDITWSLTVEPGPVSTLTNDLTIDLPVLPVLARGHRRMADGPPPPTTPPPYA